MTDLLQRAIDIATQAHTGQFDRGGHAYIEHPLRVMANCQTAEAKIVAVLHDVVEDCPEWSFERLRSEGFPDHIIDGLDAVTKRDGERYDQFIERSRLNAIGREVKIADLQDNSDLSRLPTVGEQDIARQKKYAAALEKLVAG